MYARRPEERPLDLMGPVFVQIFGQTESPMTGTVLRAEEHMVDGPLAHLLTSCGRARSGVQVRILDDKDEPVAAGTTGEICIRGGSVMPGYWERPEANAETLRGGWLHTGDHRDDGRARLRLHPRPHPATWSSPEA